MNIFYDDTGTILHAVPDDEIADFTHTTNVPLSIYHIDEIAENATLITDLRRNLFLRDQARNGKYWVNNGVLTVRDGWTPISPGSPFTPSPGYHTTDLPVSLVTVQPRELAKAALTDSTDPTRIATRNTARVLMASLIETRAAYNQLAAWARPLGYTGPTLANRNWAMALAAAKAQIDAETTPDQ